MPDRTAPTTRKPSGKPPWPFIVLSGVEKTGKTYEAVEFTRSPLIDQCYFIEWGETSADDYGAIEGADYQILNHDGTFQSMLDGLLWACRQTPAAGKINMIIFDSGTKLWNYLSDEASDRAIARERRKCERQRRTFDADADVVIGNDLWNQAKSRWYQVVDAMKLFNGIAVMTTRLEEQVAFSDGKPDARAPRVWKTIAQKALPFDCDAIVQIRERGVAVLTGVRSVRMEVPESGVIPLKPRGYLRQLIDSLQLTIETVTDRVHVPLTTEGETDGVSARTVEISEDWFIDLQNVAASGNRAAYTVMGEDAKVSGSMNALSEFRRLWPEMQAAEKELAAAQPALVSAAEDWAPSGAGESYRNGR